MHSVLHWLLLSCVSLPCFEACASEGDQGDGTVAPTPQHDGGDSGVTGEQAWQDIVSDPRQPTARRLSVALGAIEGDRCFRESDGKGCEWSDFELAPEHYELGPESEAILVIDSMPPAEHFLRYRNRIPGYFEVGGDGTIRATPVVRRWPKTMGEVIVGFATLPSVPASALQPLSSVLESTYRRHLSQGGGWGYHGLLLFSILADRVPNHSLLLVNDAPFFDQIKDSLCKVGPNSDSESAGLMDIRRSTSTLAAELRRVMAFHNVRFINVSWGMTPDAVLEWFGQCQDGAPSAQIQEAVLDAFLPLYRVLFASSGVLGVQAAIQPTKRSPLDESRPDLANRLRVGSFEYFGDDIAPTGASVADPSWSAYPSSDYYADAYVNSGANAFRKREAGSLTAALSLGVGIAPVLMPSQPSFVAPVALARVVALRKSEPFRGKAMSDALIERLKETLLCQASNLPAACRYWDPLFHHQFEGAEP